jgi:SHS2 domain-containing protein
MTGSYRILDHIALADTAFEAIGATPGELCEAAGRAVMELMADPATVGVTWEHRVDCSAETLGELLFNWLNELVYLKDAHGVLFHDIRVEVTGGEPSRNWRLRAVVSGAPVDQETQELRADIKAVTKHLFDVTRTESGWRARVVLDV